MRFTKRTNIDAVAALAGVSRATVSRVLNHTTPVSAEVRARVEAAMERTGYSPNPQARLLAGGRKPVVILVYPLADHVPTWHFYHTETGVLRGCAENGFEQQTLFVTPESPDFAEEILAPVYLGECTGMVLMPPFSDMPDLIERIRGEGLPLIIVAAGSSTRGLSAGIGLDDEQAGFEAVTYLIGLGHRRFAFIEGLPSHVSACERLTGVRRGLTEAGLSADALLSVPGKLTFDTGLEGFHRIRSHGFRPTALICANDEMAAGAMHGARQVGLSLPRDLSVVGFDDAPHARLMSPPLTTVSQAVIEMGRRAVGLLMQGVRGGGATYTLMAPELVLRDSVCPPGAT